MKDATGRRLDSFEVADVAELSATYASAATLNAGIRAATQFDLPRPKVAWLTTFGAGHGWTGSGAGGTFTVNDTTDYSLGTQSIKGVTSGSNGSITANSGTVALNMTGKNLVLSVKIADVTKLNYLTFYAGDAGMANNYAWTLNTSPVGSAIIPPFVTNGEWSTVTFSFGNAAITGSPNRAAITNFRIFGLDANTGPLTFSVGGIGTMPESGVPTVVLTFDDSPSSHFTTVYPLMASRGLRGTLYPIIGNVGTAGSMTVAQMTAMHDHGGFEIGCHASSVAAHGQAVTGMTQAERLAEFRALRDWNFSNGWEADSYAYPNGYYDTPSAADARSLFSSARSIHSKLESQPIGARDRIRTYNAAYTSFGVDWTTLKGRVDLAIANKSTLVLTFHSVVTSPSVATDTSTAVFTSLVDYLVAQNVQVLTMREAVRLTA
jgi:peptidoglycan/xylan/chitin deacetylase (PgdA/CDA1 family)